MSVTPIGQSFQGLLDNSGPEFALSFGTQGGIAGGMQNASGGDDPR
jgi:hypothetical protein